jgi:3-hydroxy-D-aspartate aldolase
MTETFPAGVNAGLVGKPGSRAALATPALILDLDAMEANMAEMVRRTAGRIGLRPHAKAGKSVAVALAQMAAGAVGICCATLGEAEAMVAAGLRGLLITSPVAGAPMLTRLAGLLTADPGLGIVADCPAHLQGYAAAAAEAGRALTVLVEFDVGQGRTGCRSQAAALALAGTLAATAGLRYGGIQAYYGHLQHVPAFADRRALCLAQAARIGVLKRTLTDAGLEPPVVTGGGTGTFEIDIEAGVFTDIQAGSYPFMDREYGEIEQVSEGAAFRPALFVQAVVISAPEPGLAVVNAGYKSFATEGDPPVLARPALAGASYALMGDEHGGVRFDPAGPGLKVGDKVELLAPHCDPTINLFDRYHCVRGEVLTEIRPVDARGK